MERRLHEDERDDGDRKRDEEVPAPAPGIRDHTAEQGAADRGERHDTAEEAHVAAALARADDVGHEHLAECGEAAGADALHRAERDQHLGVRREAGRSGRQHEDDDRELVEHLAIREVGELAPDGGRDRGGEEGCGDDPREGGLVAVEVVDDDRE